MIDRRTFLRGLALAAFAVARAAEAQKPPTIRRIGILGPNPDESVMAPFYQHLRELGWIEGQNLVVERRHAGRNEDLPKLAVELTRLNVEVIFPGGPFALRAAREATTIIPIVMAASTSDPVGQGYIQSFARPGGNITGVAFTQEDVPGKRLQLLKEAVPKLSRVGLLNEIANPTGLKPIQEAGRVIGVEVIAFVARAPADSDGAVSAAMKARVDGLIVAGTPILRRNGRELADLVTRHRIPAMGHWISFAEDGLLMGYSPSMADQFRRAAAYVDKILKGGQAGRPACGAAHEVRAGDQHEDGQGVWADASSVAALAGGSAHRLTEGGEVKPMMSERRPGSRWITRLSAVAFVLALASSMSVPEAQPRARIGVLWPAASPPQPPRMEAFREGLREVGYVEGQNIGIELRYAGDPEHLRRLSAELIRANIHVLATFGDLAPRIAQQTTTTIPIVALADDILGTGLITNLARPGKKRQTAHVVSKILKGARPADLPVEQPQSSSW
jgi:putative ABC transport system substrate-binding protein